MRRCRQSARGRARETSTSSEERLCVRCGDGDNYNDFGCDLSAVATYPLELKVRGPVARCNALGVSAVGLHDGSYISLYFGDETAQAVRRLTDSELAALNHELSREERHGR